MIKILNSFFFSLLLVVVSAKQIPPKPNPPRLVNDFTNTLSATENNQLEQKLTAYYDSTSTQIAIVIEPSLEGDDAFTYSQKLAQSWGIGEKGKNNGVLIYVALNDREIRIQTGYGMEGVLPDALAKRIIENHIIPNFRNRKYYQGLDEVTTAIILAAKGEYKNTRKKKTEDKIPTAVIVALVIMALILINRGGKGGNRNRGFRGLYGPMWWRTYGGRGYRGGSSWGGGSSFGGGFGGFGGGSFGGGGAGGRW
ncbi:MAG: TPM domain-containing protein [Bacteroidia bacterium]